jgi:hypothetical protein
MPIDKNRSETYLAPRVQNQIIFLQYKEKIYQDF